MKKTVTKTITKTKDEFYCDVCGKKLSGEELKATFPYLAITYNHINYKGKLSQKCDVSELLLDFCSDCNLKASNLLYKEYIEFFKKFSDLEEVKERIKEERL